MQGIQCVPVFYLLGQDTVNPSPPLRKHTVTTKNTSTGFQTLLWGHFGWEPMIDAGAINISKTKHRFLLPPLQTWNHYNLPVQFICLLHYHVAWICVSGYLTGTLIFLRRREKKEVVSTGTQQLALKYNSIFWVLAAYEIAQDSEGKPDW